MAKWSLGDLSGCENLGRYKGTQGTLSRRDDSREQSQGRDMGKSHFYSFSVAGVSWFKHRRFKTVLFNTQSHKCHQKMTIKGVVYNWDGWALAG